MSWHSHLVHIGGTQMEMTEVSIKHRLTKRKGVWYYRRRVPLHLVPVFNKKFIQYSLKTKDLNEAAKRRTLADVEWDAQFDKALEENEPGANFKTTLSQSEALKIVRDYLEAADHKWKIQEAKHGLLTEEQKKDIEIELGMSEQMLADPTNPEADVLVGTDGHKLLDEYGYKLKPTTDDHAQFFEFMRRALLELYRRSLSRHHQDFSKPFFDHLFGPETHPTISTQDMTFGKLCDQYFESVVTDASNKKVSQQRLDQVGSRLKLIREIIPEDTPVYAIDYDQCLAFRETLTQVPANRTKIYPGVPLQETIERADKEGRPLLAYETQSGYLNILTKVLKLAKNKKLISNVFTEGMTPNAVKIAAKKKRDPFSNEQIKQFFQCSYYQECAKGKDHPYKKAKKTWRFWLPLLCLFMGMRPKEVCQMYLSDVKETESGTPYVHIIATDDEGDNNDPEAPKKTTKTEASKRKIPIHPELVRVGLLDYVKETIKAGETMFLPGLKPNKYGNPAWYPLKRFREKFLSEVLTMDKKQTFYSFRHSFRDALRRMEASPEILQAIGAWSQGSLVSDNYGSQHEPDQLLKYVERIEYPGLDLSHLYMKDEAK